MTQDIDPPRSSAQQLALPGFLGLILLSVCGPLFLRLPVTNDAVLYDLESRWLEDGVLPYRDIVEANFPGVLVIHSCTRKLLGPSGEALRIVDLVIFSLILLVGFRLISLASRNLLSGAWFAVFGLLFYLSQSEWCHCQRDTWLLLPALLGGLLRTNQVRRSERTNNLMTFAHSLVEGLVWGAGIWLKPHLVIVCVVLWVLSLFILTGVRRKFVDASGLLAGGLIAGAVGLGWLIQVGAFEAFVTSLSEWNPGYLAARTENWTQKRYVEMSFRLAPWTLLHLVAIPISLWSIVAFVSKSSARNEAAFLRAGLSGIYLFWFLQAHLLQHLFDYVHVPLVILALLVLGAFTVEYRFLRMKSVIFTFALFAVITSPFFKPEQMNLWMPSLQGNLTSVQTDQLARLPNPIWEDLAKVESFLRKRDVEDEDVLMFNSDLVTLYWDLDLISPTPYVYMFELQHYFPSRQELFLASMEQGAQRFVVTDLAGCGLPPVKAEEIGPEGPLAPPPAYTRAKLTEYPWSEPVVFRSGRYMVHAVRAAAKR